MTQILDAFQRVIAVSDADMAFFDRLALAREQIQRQRHYHYDLTADTEREHMVCLLENWLDPAGMASAKARADEAGKRAAAAALLTDPDTGF